MKSFGTLKYLEFKDRCTYISLVVVNIYCDTDEEAFDPIPLSPEIQETNSILLFKKNLERIFVMFK